jgi:hypothetical protein
MRLEDTASLGPTARLERPLSDGSEAVAASPELELAAPCANCGAPLGGRYCSGCGQEARSLHQPLRGLVAEWAGDVLAFDSRLARTFRRLVRRPGGLTVDVWEGRRARYVPPLRLYLFVSFFFFVILAWLDVPLSTMNVDGRAVHGGGAVVGARATPEELDALSQQGLPGRLLVAALRDPQGFERRLLDHFPVAVFLLVPVLASLLQLLLRPARRFWLEHLVFALHVHTFGLFALATATLLNRALATDLFGAVAVFGSGVHLALALRRAYAARWRRVIPVTIVLAVAYTLAVAVVMFLLAVVTAALA